MLCLYCRKHLTRRTYEINIGIFLSVEPVMEYMGISGLEYALIVL